LQLASRQVQGLSGRFAAVDAEHGSSGQSVLAVKAHIHAKSASFLLCVKILEKLSLHAGQKKEALKQTFLILLRYLSETAGSAMRAALILQSTSEDPACARWIAYA
jgi:hypothetical protein